eukprot:Anaeramoba_flamelloidesa816258_221.p2 GENE.a816258_221~~a816258_221.p2  ORF type:complete len:146 (+),score=10.19 a816258_221:507-944(+)
MKKLMTVCAACMVAGMVSAQVESQNIVGYQTASTDQSLYLVGYNFQAVGGGNELITDAFPKENFNADKHPADGGAGDQLLVYVDGAYTTYNLCDGYYAGTYYAVIDGWVKGVEFSTTTEVIPAGAAFWYRNNGAATFTWTNVSPL